MPVTSTAGIAVARTFYLYSWEPYVLSAEWLVMFATWVFFLYSIYKLFASLGLRLVLLLDRRLRRKVWSTLVAHCCPVRVSKRLGVGRAELLVSELVDKDLAILQHHMLSVSMFCVAVLGLAEFCLLTVDRLAAAYSDDHQLRPVVTPAWLGVPDTRRARLGPPSQCTPSGATPQDVERYIRCLKSLCQDAAPALLSQLLGELADDCTDLVNRKGCSSELNPQSARALVPPWVRVAHVCGTQCLDHCEDVIQHPEPLVALVSPLPSSPEQRDSAVAAVFYAVFVVLTGVVCTVLRGSAPHKLAAPAFAVSCHLWHFAMRVLFPMQTYWAPEFPLIQYLLFVVTWIPSFWWALALNVAKGLFHANHFGWMITGDVDALVPRIRTSPPLDCTYRENWSWGTEAGAAVYAIQLMSPWFFQRILFRVLAYWIVTVRLDDEQQDQTLRLVDALCLGTMQLTLDLKILQVAPGLLEVLVQDPAVSVVGMTLYHLVVPDDRDFLREVLKVDAAIMTKPSKWQNYVQLVHIGLCTAARGDTTVQACFTIVPDEVHKMRFIVGIGLPNQPEKLTTGPRPMSWNPGQESSSEPDEADEPDDDLEGPGKRRALTGFIGVSVSPDLAVDFVHDSFVSLLGPCEVNGSLRSRFLEPDKIVHWLQKERQKILDNRIPLPKKYEYGKTRVFCNNTGRYRVFIVKVMFPEMRLEDLAKDNFRVLLAFERGATRYGRRHRDSSV